MISEEKLIHILHLVIDGIYQADLVDYPDEDLALKEAKKVALGYLSHFKKAEDTARQKILSQRNPPVEFSQQWDNLYQKYLQEELKKLGA